MVWLGGTLFFFPHLICDSIPNLLLPNVVVNKIVVLCSAIVVYYRIDFTSTES